jgi:SAM-dependent methyltransferase
MNHQRSYGGMPTDQTLHAVSAGERQRWEAHYRTGQTPWDTRITPPEVVDFWASHPVPPGGLALDLGCGPCTNVAYLAKLGLRVIGFDLSGYALALGLLRLRSDAPELLAKIQLLQADVTRLPIRQREAGYILDIGCLHGLPPDRRRDYAQGVIDNLAAGGHYHLFAFDLRPESDRPAGKPPQGMGEDEVATLFAPALQVIEIVQGRPDRQPCRWYLLRRT